MIKIALAFIFLFCSALHAEMRLWQDKNGNFLEAEFICEMAEKIILRDAKGKDYKVSLSALSQKDQNYLISKLPPEVEITFSKKQDRRRHEYYSDVDMQCEVTIRKKSRMPYTGQLKAILFVIGDASRNREYVMLDRTEVNFDFKNSKHYSFKSAPFRMRQYNSEYYYSDGVKYAGYLVVVYDEMGNKVEVKSSRDEFTNHLKEISGFKAGERFSRDMQSKTNIRTF